jgi:cell division protein FtsQ
MAAQFSVFASLLAPIGRVPVKLRLSERRAWEVELDNGAVLELGRNDLTARLQRFVSAYQNTVGKLPAQAYRIDLRYPNGFALRQPGLRWGQRPA